MGYGPYPIAYIDAVFFKSPKCKIFNFKILELLYHIRTLVRMDNETNTLVPLDFA